MLFHGSTRQSEIPENMSTNNLDVEEIPHASVLSLHDLERLLTQQEARSRDILGAALAKKREAKHLLEQANKSEGKAQSLRVRYEKQESALQEIRKLIVEKNKQTLEEQFEATSLGRAVVKRPRVSIALPDSATAQADQYK
jgi:predicted DNA-binding WGR domain protein